MRIYIYSIPRESAFGIHDWTSDTSGRKLKKTKIGKCRDAIQALYSPKVGGLLNGLSYHPWIENGIQVKDDKDKPLTLQHKLERKWGLDTGYLSNKAWMRGDSTKESDMTYFQRKSWKLNDGATMLNLDNFDDEMFYYVCLDSKFVATSEKEWREYKWPKATHYIALENEAEEIKFKRNEVKSKAFATLHSEAMTPTMRHKIASILELATSKGTITSEQSLNLLYEYIDKTTFGPNSNLDKFTAITNLLSTPKGREEIEARFLLKQALDTRVVWEKQGAYNWVRPTGQIVLGETYAEAIDFVLNPKKQQLVEDLEKEIKAKTY